MTDSLAARDFMPNVLRQVRNSTSASATMSATRVAVETIGPRNIVRVNVESGWERRELTPEVKGVRELAPFKTLRACNGIYEEPDEVRCEVVLNSIVG